MESVITPNHNDVLFGRGNGTNHHHGNKEFRALIQSKKEEYANAKTGEKGEISKYVLEIIHNNNGRFLEKGDKIPGKRTYQWNVATEKKALAKISQCLREIQKKKPSSDDVTVDEDINKKKEDGKQRGKSSEKKKKSSSFVKQKKKVSRRKSCSTAVENLLGDHATPNDMTMMEGMLIPPPLPIDPPNTDDDAAAADVEQIPEDPRLAQSMPPLPTPTMRRPSRKMSLPKRWMQQFQSKTGEKNLLGDFDPSDLNSLRGGPGVALPQASVSKFEPGAFLDWNADSTNNKKKFTKRGSFLRSQQSIDKEHLMKKKKSGMLYKSEKSLDLDEGMNLLLSKSKLSDFSSSSKNLLSHLLVTDTSHLHENDEFERLANMIASVNEMSIKSGNENSSLMKEAMVQLSSTRGGTGPSKIPENITPLPHHQDVPGFSDVLDSKLTMDFSDKSYARGDAKTKAFLDANMSLRSLGQFSSDHNFMTTLTQLEDQDEEKTNQLLNIAL